MPKTLTHPVLSEREFQEQVMQLAKLTGWACYHTWLSVRSTAGFPDLVLVRPPRVLFVELKTEGGKVTTAQRDWMLNLGACPGVEVKLWWPSDWNDVEETLKR
jgi:hypothetical protein